MSTLNPKTAGYVNLSYCVAQVRADIQDYSDRNIERFTQWAIRCYTDANLYHSINVEVVYLEMDADGVIDISTLTDYVDYVKVGIPVNGKIWILGKNDKILKRRDELDASELALIYKTGAPDIDVGSGYVFADHYINGSFVTGMFGLGGGFNRSFFTIDTELMQIQFSSSVHRSQVILEYISTGVNASGATVVPRQYAEYIIEYIHWMIKKNDPLANRFDKRDAKQDFIERETMLDNFNYRFNTEEYFNSLYQNYKQTVKM
jgi:hypothetical protein